MTRLTMAVLGAVLVAQACSKPAPTTSQDAGGAAASAVPSAAASSAVSGEWIVLYDVEHPRDAKKPTVPESVKSAAAALPISPDAGKLTCRDPEPADAVEGSFSGGGQEQAVLMNRSCDRADVPEGASRKHEVVSFVVVHASGKVSGAFAVPESTKFGGVVRASQTPARDAFSLIGEHAGGGDCQGWLMIYEVDKTQLRELKHFERAYNCSCPDCKEGRGKLVKAKFENGSVSFDAKKIPWVVDPSCPCNE